MIEEVLLSKREIVEKNWLEMCFNHYFVIDVKPAICWDDNCLYDLSTINWLIDEEDLINKM